MSKHLVLFPLLAGAVIFFCNGCNSYKGDFVQKSEEQLEAMEKISEQANLQFVMGKYHLAEAIINNSLCRERTVSLPLYNLEKASVYLMQKRDEEAHKLMLSIADDMEYLTDKQMEEKAQSLWHGEANKVFKGDAYEQSTLYALLAMSFMQRNEYEDAIRCVKNGLLADSASGKEQYTSDYMLLQYIGYICSKQLGQQDDAAEYLREIDSLLKLRALPQIDRRNCYGSITDIADANALICVWAGNPPTIIRYGDYKHKRSPIHGQEHFHRLFISVNGNALRMMPNRIGDVNFQATTRGGRLMDEVLADKAMAKDVAKVSGNILLIGGFGMITASRFCPAPLNLIFLSAGGGCLIAGGVAHIIGACINSTADGRYWKNLPYEFFVMPVKLLPGRNEVRLAGFRNGDATVDRVFIFNQKPGNSKIQVHHLPFFNNGANAGNIADQSLQQLKQIYIDSANLKPMAYDL